jgi:hypothetical protein
MPSPFHDRFREYPKEKLFSVILNAGDYQPEAIEAARDIVREKKWSADLENELGVQKKEDELKQEEYDKDISEKAEYYRQEVEFRKQNNSFQIRIADIPKLEGALADKGIRYFREDKNVGPQIDTYPTQTYFFKDEDVAAVDEISRSMGLITSPYTDYKPFFGLEMKIVLVVIVITLLGLLVMKIV